DVGREERLRRDPAFDVDRRQQQKAADDEERRDIRRAPPVWCVGGFRDAENQEHETTLQSPGTEPIHLNTMLSPHMMIIRDRDIRRNQRYRAQYRPDP